MNIGNLITQYRKEANLTIDDLVERSGVPRGTLNKIIAGTTKAPTLDNIKSIARALGKRLDDFDDTPSSTPSFTPQELGHIKKYRTLDEYGKEVVDFVLDKEAARSEAQRKESEFIPVMMVARNGERGIVMASKDTMKDAEFSDTGDL